MHYINENGRLRPADALLHGAEAATALYGDGLFETVRIEHSRVLLWHRHWARLSEGMAALLLQVPEEWNQDFFAEEVERTAEATGMAAACRARLHVYPGEGGVSCFTIACAALPVAPTNGLRLGISARAVKYPGPQAHLKTCNALPYRIATREAELAGWDDAVLLNPAGRIVETTRSNIFLLKGGTVFVNSPAEGCIAGVMRAQVIEWMQDWGLLIQESSLTVEMLMTADAVFLTNAVRRLQAVRAIAAERGAAERTYDVALVAHIVRLVEQKFIALQH